MNKITDYHNEVIATDWLRGEVVTCPRWVSGVITGSKASKYQKSSYAFLSHLSRDLGTFHNYANWLAQSQKNCDSLRTNLQNLKNLVTSIRNSYYCSSYNREPLHYDDYTPYTNSVISRVERMIEGYTNLLNNCQENITAA